MPITLTQNILKIVMSFTKTGTTESAIRTFLINNIWPALQIKINTKMTNNFDPGWSKINKLSVFSTGVDKWEIYPKFAITGTTNLTGSQLRSGVSDLLRDLKTTLITEGTALGATNMKFHVHYQDGRAAEGDEF